MRVWIGCVVMLLSTACGGSPTAPAPQVVTTTVTVTEIREVRLPSDALPTITLELLVTGNTTGKPLAGVPVNLKGFSQTKQFTDAAGRAWWKVFAGETYAVEVCGSDGSKGVAQLPASPFHDVVFWQTSLPEWRCGL